MWLGLRVFVLIMFFGGISSVCTVLLFFSAPEHFAIE